MRYINSRFTDLLTCMYASLNDLTLPRLKATGAVFSTLQRSPSTKLLYTLGPVTNWAGDCLLTGKPSGLLGMPSLDLT